MSKLPLVEGVLKYVKEKNICFSMPGHKQGRGFETIKEGREILDKFINCDITEVEGVDNLHNAEGIIKQATEKLSLYYGSKKSYFLVNGSTSGNLIMIFSSFKEGDKVIVDRNCHKSIFNGIIMRKLNPIYVSNKVDKTFNVPLSIDSNDLIEVISKNKDAKGIILTYPNYYGVCCSLENIISEAKKYKMKVIVDSAHGAHFGVNDLLPKSAVKLGADMVVVSAHKTLPSLTQTAFLHVNNESLINNTDFYFSSFSSTSPSYLFMITMDYARYFLEQYGNEYYSSLIDICKKYKKKINDLNYIHILEKDDIQCEIDESRYIINLKKGYNSSLLLTYLRDNNIQCEMSDTYNLVLIFSPFNSEDEFKYLYEVLKKCNISKIKGKYINILEHPLPKRALVPYEVLEMNKVKVNIEDALGRICGENIVPYPPGVPIIMMGEVIDDETLNMIKYYLKNNIDVIGVSEDKITVIEK